VVAVQTDPLVAGLADSTRMVAGTAVIRVGRQVGALALASRRFLPLALWCPVVAAVAVTIAIAIAIAIAGRLRAPVRRCIAVVACRIVTARITVDRVVGGRRRVSIRLAVEAWVVLERAGGRRDQRADTEGGGHGSR